MGLVAPLISLIPATVNGECTNAHNQPFHLSSDHCDALSCSGSHWKVTAGSIFLERSRPGSLALMQDTTDPTRMLNANAFDFGLDTGWELALGRQLKSGQEIEFRYFGVEHFDARANVVTNPGGGLLRINTAPPTFDPNVQSIASWYDSQLHSFEFNLRGQWSEYFTVLGGFRYLEVDERLHAELTTPAPTFTYDAMTRNRLYGAQIGLEATLWRGEKLTVDVTGKSGIFANSAGHTTIHDTTATTDVAIDENDDAAFVGELGIAGLYSLTQCISVRVGYQLLWLDSVALASAQIPVTNFGSGRGIDGNGHAFFHGAFVGFEILR